LIFFIWIIIFFYQKKKKGGAKNEVLKKVDMDDKELLYRLVTREAGNQDTYGMRLIVDVVLNRVNDDRFPGNIKDVLYSPGQFDGAKDLSLVTPYDTCKRAVDMELNCDLEGSRLDYESIYFARSPHTKNHYKHGDHYFSH
jgi:N-acetylmuramoyl-L-alanine amidase